MYSLLGWQFIRQKDHQDDIKDKFDKALELDKDNEDAKKGLSIYYNNLGIACGNALKGEAAEAINYFLWALHYAPTEKAILNNLKRVSYSKYKEHVNALKERGITIDEEDEV